MLPSLLQWAPYILSHHTAQHKHAISAMGWWVQVLERQGQHGVPVTLGFLWCWCWCLLGRLVRGEGCGSAQGGRGISGSAGQRGQWRCYIRWLIYSQLLLLVVSCGTTVSYHLILPTAYTTVDCLLSNALNINARLHVAGTNMKLYQSLIHPMCIHSNESQVQHYHVKLTPCQVF